MQEEIWFRPLVWMDYRLAVLFTVIVPLILIFWAAFQKTDALVRLLIIYWRVSSLLAITVFLMIGAAPVAFVSSFFARILIPISLWFWIDVNEEIDDMSPRPLKLALTGWRWAITIYCILGTLAFTPFLQCGFSQGMVKKTFCQVWMEAPWLLREYLFKGYKPNFLSFIGIVALIIYVVYLVYFALIRLGKQGRSAMQL